MATIMPQGEALRKAVKWISDERKAKTGDSDGKLISDASARFDLNPKDAEFLNRFLKESKDKQGSQE